MRKAATRATKRPGASALDVKRVVVDLPATLFARAERAVAELGTTRSDLIRQALKGYLKSIERSKLERVLVEGYAANAEQARQACEELTFPDSEFL